MLRHEYKADTRIGTDPDEKKGDCTGFAGTQPVTGSANLKRKLGSPQYLSFPKHQEF
jgi:hypothetical protein